MCKLYVDFDGCIVNTIQCICKLYNEDFKYYNNFEVVPWVDINTWNFKELKCATEECINAYFNQPRFFENINYMPWAKELLTRLSENYEIVIVSSGSLPNLKQKAMWIKDNLSFAEFVGVNVEVYSDKSHIDMSDGIFIDDVAKNLETSNAKVKVCFGDKYPWNEEWKGIRCVNWHEVNNCMHELI